MWNRHWLFSLLRRNPFTTTNGGGDGWRWHVTKTSAAPDPNNDLVDKEAALAAASTIVIQAPNPSKKWMSANRHSNNRALSTIQTQSKDPASGYSIVSKDETRDFMAAFPDVVRDLTDVARKAGLPDVAKHWTKSLHYNVPTGKKTRGLAVIAAYKLLEKPENLTPENLRLANIMGWCVELLQSFLLVCDDIIDRSETRRGSPCWYRHQNVGLLAINDGIMLYECVYRLLSQHFSLHPCYLPILQLFHEITLKTAMGQTLDSLSQLPNGRPKFDIFTMSNYNAIIKYKTAYYTFQLPISLAMYMANICDDETHRQAKTILLEMGHFFQIQDDFLDCFGDPEKTGKKSNDIREGKCTWPAVVALQRVNAAQRKLMEECYGRDEPQAIQAIKNLYEELSLPRTYTVYEEESYNMIRTHIQQISQGLPHKLFFKLMTKLYKRDH